MRPRLQNRIDRWSERLAANPFRRAWRAILVVTVVATVVGGVLVRLSDPSSISSLASGLWWSLQTVTTVGYGDVVPASTLGRLVAAIVMLVGLSFLAVTTAAVTNAFVQAAARRRGQDTIDALLPEIRQLRAEVAELRAQLHGSEGNRADESSRDAPRAPSS